MKLTVRHTLTFSLGTPSRAVEHLLLTAVATPQQKIERWSIEMPGMAEAAAFRDGFGNRAHLVSQIRPEPELTVIVNGAVETFDRAGVLGRLEFDPSPALFRRPSATIVADPELCTGLQGRTDRIAVLHELMARVHEAVAGGQEQMQEAGVQEQVQRGTVTPMASAEAFVGAARTLDIAARYVTGYLLDEGVASAHAWAEAWDEGLGWVGFDPVQNVCPAESYIRLAAGLDATGTMRIRSVPGWLAPPVEAVEIEAA